LNSALYWRRFAVIIASLLRTRILLLVPCPKIGGHFKFLGNPAGRSGQSSGANPGANPGSESHHPLASSQLSATLSDIGATLIGALVIAFNIAPTNEVPMIAAAISEPWLIAIAIASLIISYGIVFEAGFSNQQKRRQQRGIFQRPLSETIAAYLMSLLAAAFMLWFFQQVMIDDPWQIWLSYSLVLGLPATIGGSAGRLAL
jgi:putative integral membrane protein (TIGR02587 family)